LVVVISKKLHIPRSVAVLAVLLGLAGVIAGVIALVGPPTVDQAKRLGTEAPKVLNELGDLPIVGSRLRSADVPGAIDRFVQTLPQRLSAGSVANITKSILDSVLVAVVTLLLAIALLFDGERLVRLGRQLVPEHRRADADRIGRLTYHVVGKYAIGSLVVAA